MEEERRWKARIPGDLEALSKGETPAVRAGSLSLKEARGVLANVESGQV